jgi:hypothetical protein
MRTLRLTPYRVVEAQHRIATRKLVDTVDEQLLLEQLLEAVKPPEPTRGRQHYLLFTPFRYPPLRQGSRFGTRHDPGIWYGSETIDTALAEVAYYRFVFLDGTRADLGPGAIETPLTAFTVRLSTRKGFDLVATPFAAHRSLIASPTSYSDTQALGQAMRDAGVEAFRYPSARDPRPRRGSGGRGGVNVGVFTPPAFGTAKPRNLETWHCTATRHRVELSKQDYFTRRDVVFLRDMFLVSGALPAPAL